MSPTEGRPPGPVELGLAAAAFHAALDALATSAIPVALLRDPEAGEYFVEIDLLVPPQLVRRARRALVRHGFAELRSRGHRGHHFLVTWDRVTGAWLKLDLVSRPAGADAAQVLERRRRSDGLPRLEPSLEASLLALHCAVDKRGRLGRHSARLRRAAEQPPPPPPGAPPRLDEQWSKLWRAIRLLDDRSLQRLARSVTAAATPPAERARAYLDRVLRLALLLRRAAGPGSLTIVVETAGARKSAFRCDQVARELGHPSRRVRSSGRSDLSAAVGLRARQEMARRLSPNPVLVEAVRTEARLIEADLVLAARDETAQDTLEAAGRKVSELVWRRYRER